MQPPSELPLFSLDAKVIINSLERSVENLHLLPFAGLWDRWKDPITSERLLSCTIIVSGASAWMEPYYDRMPVLLEAKDFDGWLNGSLGTEALKPAPEEALREWKVSPRLNRTGVGDDDPAIIEPLPAEAAAQDRRTGERI